MDIALVVDVLPNTDDSGKDLGVVNMANAVPQTVAPVFGAALLAVSSSNNQTYILLLHTRRRRRPGRRPCRPPDQKGEVADAGHRTAADRAHA